MEGKPTHEEMLNASTNGVLATDAGGRIVFMNTRAREILGLDIRSSIGSHISKVLPLDRQVISVCLKNGTPLFGHQVPGKSPDIVVNITGIRRNGGIQGILCSFVKVEDLEISARKLESYKRLNKQWNAVFKSSSDGILVSDNKGNIIMMNEASEKLNGIEAKNVIGRNVIDFVKSGVFDRSVTMEVLETRRQVSIMQYISKTKKHLLVTGTPAFDEYGNIILIVVNERDMTQLDALKSQLEQSRMVTEKFRDELVGLSMLEMKKQEILADSTVMRETLVTALKLAQLDASNILVLGESGTGKGLLAKFIHNNSKRKGKPFVQINCAALPEGLLEAELFGYEKGAFTGAREHGKVGLFELAQGGTLFLDEIGDLPLSVQAKLLKYLDDNEIMRLGGVKPIKVDCTIIAATNRDIVRLTKTRAFRNDLFYRLNTFPVRIPPLRERREDIFGLVDHYLRKYNSEYGLRRRMSPDGFAALQAYPFPGNVRELKNTVKKAVVMSDKEVLDEFILKSLKNGAGVPKGAGIKSPGGLSLNDEVLAVEKELLRSALPRCRSTREMADFLHVSQPTIVRKLKKHGLAFPSMHK